jgi:nucleoside-triphosphatase
MTKKNILLTGLPGVGKTTLIKKLSKELAGLHPVGFYTEEIREGGIRKGFALISLNGTKGLLSHIEIEGPYRVGKYRVDVKGFEDFIDSVAFSAHETNLVIIDEIGKMECMSSKFRRFIKEILDSEKLVIATIALKGKGLIEEIKKRNDVWFFEVTRGNRDSLLVEILKEASRIRQTA